MGLAWSGAGRASWRYHPAMAQDTKQVLIDALGLAAERVTGDDLAAKDSRRRYLLELKAGVMVGGEAAPSSQELAEALGDPEDSILRQAISAWGEPAGEGT
jgi:hypothetical protein